MAYRRPKNPARDRRLTESLHRLVRGLKPPPKAVDGVKWDPIRYPIDWPGWPRVQVDVRMLRRRGSHA